eukprot:TRINITY_DN25467_c0_g1_i2.p2 TRINITY_DN25467_c0_g1~~TRINITY_DN25467_c0_g1_i2.p2  ORF type:complete len:134 (+),score=29.32 TRINITY_DN25467_c0_g1_i2:95-496(+)
MNIFFFFKQKTAYEMQRGLVGSEMCIRDRDNNRTHPTVDEIFSSLIPIIPTLSKMTIYNTLKLFSAKGLIKSIPNSENVGHYDYKVTPHSHFKCRKCKKVYDIDVDLGVTIGTNIDVYQIDEYNLILEGICKD